MYATIFQGDYKTQFENAVTGLINEHIEDRTERMAAMDQLIEDYVEQTGNRPAPRQLDRLATHILYEELNGDPRPDKVTLEEEPILTFGQVKRRHDKEVSDLAFSVIGSDRKVHTTPTRRGKTLGEMIAIDNAVRRKEDEQPSKVKTYKLEG